MKLTYGVKDRPTFGKLLVFALQQLLAIMAATIVVPIITNGNTAEQVAKGIGSASDMGTTAALFGAGVGTLVYLLFTKFKSPVFLGSSFAFLGSMAAAFAGAATAQLGYLGLIIGAALAGLVYVIIAVIVKFVGSEWLNKLMPPVVIGPTVAIIGLSLASSAIGDLQKTAFNKDASIYLCIICGLVTLAVTMICSYYGKKMRKMIPFVIGIIAGYAVALIFTVLGKYVLYDNSWLIINLDSFRSLLNADGNVFLGTFLSVPDFTFLKVFDPATGAFPTVDLSYIGTVAVAYVPVAFVVFAEHVADHKNISSIIEADLLKDPGLHRTLLGDGVGSFAGAVFGGCPNTTYGESIGCVAISGNASVITIFTTALMAIAVSFLSPFAVFLASIPNCVMGGVCMALYGFIAVSGLKMVQKVDLEDNRNLFVTSVILIAGIGGLSISFGKVTITTIACALILGILTNVMLSGKKSDQ